MTILERLAARVLGLPVVECAVCGGSFVRLGVELACATCRERPDWRSGTYRVKEWRRSAMEARERERQERHAPILQLRAQGLGYKAIATELGLSRDSVRYICLYHERPGAGVVTGPRSKAATPPVSIYPPDVFRPES